MLPLLLPLLFASVSSSLQASEVDGPRIGGTVRDESGAPVAGAKVTLVDPHLSRECPDLFVGSSDNLYLAARPKWGKPREWRARASATADRQGNFVLSAGVEATTGILVTTADGFAPDLEPIGKGVLPNVVLERGEDVEIHFLTENRKPVENGEGTLVPLFVCARLLQAMPDLFVWRQKGDAEGTLSFRNVPRGTYGMRLEGSTVSATVSPLVVRKGGVEYRVEMPEDFVLKGSVVAPSRTRQSTGTVMAYWKERDGPFQWSEATFSAEDGSFVMNRVPWASYVRFLAWSGNGLYSPVMTREELGYSDEPQTKNPIQINLPAEWNGRLSEGAAVTSLIIQFLLPDEAPPDLRFDPIEVSVDAARRFVIPEVPPPAIGLRLIAPGAGSAEVKLKAGSAGDLGIVKLQPGLTILGRAIWEDRSPLQDAQVEVLSTSGSLCEGPVDLDGRFVCVPAGAIPGSGELRFRAHVGQVEFRLVPQPGDASTLVADPGVPITIHVSRPGGKEAAENLRFECGSRSPGGKGSPQPLYARSPGGDLTLHLLESLPSMLTLSNPAGVPRVVQKVVASNDPAKKLEWVLPEAHSLFGTVAAASSGRAIEGAEVGIAMSPSEPGGSIIFQIAHTSVDGSWRQGGFSEGSYRAVVAATGYAAAGKQIAIPSEAKIAHRFLLTSPGRIHGKVLGIPEKWKGDIMATSNSSEVGWTDYQADLDSKGEFTIESVRPDRYIVTMLLRMPVSGKARTPSSRRAVSVLVKPGETSEIEFDLQGITLSGEARLGTSLMKNTEMTFYRVLKTEGNWTTDRIVTDEEGRYRVTLANSGKYMVLAFLRDKNNEHSKSVLDPPSIK